jgi:hypothetical protein
MYWIKLFFFYISFSLFFPIFFLLPGRYTHARTRCTPPRASPSCAARELPSPCAWQLGHAPEVKQMAGRGAGGRRFGVHGTSIWTYGGAGGRHRCRGRSGWPRERRAAGGWGSSHVLHGWGRRDLAGCAGQTLAAMAMGTDAGRTRGKGQGSTV